MKHLTTRAIAPLLIASMSLGLSGCGESKSTDGDSSTAPPAAGETSTSAVPPASQPAVDVKMKTPATPATIVAAPAAYGRVCAMCHGSGGLGDGAMAKQLATPPRSLVDAKWMTFESSTEAEERAGLANVIRNGITDQGMPAFGGSLSDADVEAIIDFIFAIRPK